MAKAKAAANGNAGIEVRLANIDALLKEKVLAVAGSLLPGAKKAAIDKLAPIFGGTVPADIRAWFSWHNGHKQDSYESLIPDTNWSAMSIQRVLDSYNFLTTTARESPDDIMLPVKDEWIPLFENGGGDYLCFDRQTGKIIWWMHDDADRDVEYKSFAALVETIERGYAGMKSIKSFPAPTVKTWKAVAKKPTEKQLEASTVGVAYLHQTKGDQWTQGMNYIYVKLGDNRWLTCFGGSREDALEHWKKHAAKPPVESSGYYKRTWDVWYELKTAKAVKLGT